MSKYNKKYNKTSNDTSGGAGLLGALQIIFIVLKCCNLVDWAWWQVFLPFFIGLGFIAIFCIALLVIVWGAARDKH